jgi:hypothetical protein
MTFLDVVGKLGTRAMAAKYDEVQIQTTSIEAELGCTASTVNSIEYFIGLCREHSYVKRLTKSIVNRFIDKIVVHHVL